MVFDGAPANLRFLVGVVKINKRDAGTGSGVGGSGR
jgi:hypothetical protein